MVYEVRVVDVAAEPDRVVYAQVFEDPGGPEAASPDPEQGAAPAPTIRFVTMPRQARRQPS